MLPRRCWRSCEARFSLRTTRVSTQYSFLRSEFRKAGVAYTAEALCTVKLSRGLFPEHVRHNLDVVIERHALTCSARHRARFETPECSGIRGELQREIPADVFAAASAHAVLKPPQTARATAGGTGRRVAGVARGVSLLRRRCRVAVHRPQQFAAQQDFVPAGRAARGSREQVMAQLVQRVDWRQTAGELGAMLLESEWIKSQQPRYNRRARSNAESVTLSLADASGRVRIQRIDMLEPEDLAESFGVFHSEKDARKALTDIARLAALSQSARIGTERRFVLRPAGRQVPRRLCRQGTSNPALDAREIGALCAGKLKAGRFQDASRCASGQPEHFCRMERAAASFMCSIIGCIWDRRVRRGTRSLEAAPRVARIRCRCLQDSAALFLASSQPRLA